MKEKIELEGFKSISKRQLLIVETLANLNDNYYYSDTELEIGLEINLLAVFGTDELREAMFADGVDLRAFIDEAEDLIKDIRTGEYKEFYNDVLRQIREGANAKANYCTSLTYQIKEALESFKGINLEEIMNNPQIKEAIESVTTKSE